MNQVNQKGTNAVNGSRLRCDGCGAEAIVMKAIDPTLGCCDQPLTIIFSPGGSAPAAK